MTESIASARRASPPELEATAENDPTVTTRTNDAVVAPAPLSPEDVLAIEHLVTEDDTPVDNLFSERQRRLLTHPLNVSWQGPGDGRYFLVAADVGVFRTPHEPPLVPDVFLSLDVKRPTDWWAKEGRSYFMWYYKKPPDVVIEIVSNKEGEETGEKIERYASFGVPCYVIFDPQAQVQDGLLRVYELASGAYAPRSADILPGVELGLRLWRGEYEGDEATWLRWHDASGALIQTGEETTERERNRAEQAEDRAERERNRAERLAAQLRALGVTPEDNGHSV
ncbi:MAG: Uma2 family endonuclease [Caldilineaceae bacterium SB0661_bin_32]|uniref:Uma2 family endonuclease n=1 Tax=Caldilineaceae bacterium SB0661_bin_32 TaxID=2605255 RepID=A0A6B1D5Y3_9CHLR|nr:Uma2 family endonuclease [Caldilineaceae bacterium SB0661_bin_32]